eukprot:5241937-Prymnesium_polylepis.1
MASAGDSGAGVGDSLLANGGSLQSPRSMNNAQGGTLRSRSPTAQQREAGHAGRSGDGGPVAPNAAGRTIEMSARFIEGDGRWARSMDFIASGGEIDAGGAGEAPFRVTPMAFVSGELPATWPLSAGVEAVCN